MRRVWNSPTTWVLLLLAAVVAMTAVVNLAREPGAMTVLESQAMDMAHARPPVGAVPVAVSEARLEPFQPTVTYTGSVVAWNDEDVVARVTGRVVDVPVYPGDRVESGQVLVVLDSEELGARTRAAWADARLSREQARAEAAALERSLHEVTAGQDGLGLALLELEMARAEVPAAAAEVEYREEEFRRTAFLFQEQGASREELEQDRSQVEQARAARRQADLTVKKAEVRVQQVRAELAAVRARQREARSAVGASLSRSEAAVASAQAAEIVESYTRITAQAPGQVSERLVSPGTLVHPGTPVLRVKQTDTLRLQARVPAGQAARIQPGHPVLVRTWRDEAPLLETTVSAVFAAADASSRTVTVEAPVRNASLFPGEFVEMTIGVDRETERLTIPLAALRRDLTDSPFVWSLAGEPSVARRVPVVPGPEADDRLAILEGLEPGDLVVVQGGDELQSGTVVRPVDWGVRGPLEPVPHSGDHPGRHSGH